VTPVLDPAPEQCYEKETMRDHGSWSGVVALNGLIAFAAAAFPAAAPVRCNFELIVTSTIDTHGDDSASKVRIEQRFGIDPSDRARIASIRNGEPFLIRLIPRVAEVLEAGGVGQDGSAAVFETLPKTSPPVAPGHEPIADQVRRGNPEAPAGHWPGGFIHRGPKQLPTIELPLPLLQPANSAAEEAAGCWWEWPVLEISYSKLRDLHSLLREFSEPVAHEEAPGCEGTMTVKIEADVTSYLPDPEDPVTSSKSCTNNGGFVNLHGICQGGDFSCYRVEEPDKVKKPKGARD